MTGLYVVLGVLVLATAVGLLLRNREGRVRTPEQQQPVLPEALRAELGLTAELTLVQLSSTFCAPCRQTRALLSHLAEQTEDLAHVDLDVTDRVELTRQLHVLRTPTTLAVDASGRELFRFSGVPVRAELDDALARYLRTP